MRGRTPTRCACDATRSSSVYFSTTVVICRPIFVASMTISMYSSSLKPLQMIGVSLSATARTASSSGFEPASSPNPYGRPNWKISSTTWRCWFTLIGYTHE